MILRVTQQEQQLHDLLLGSKIPPIGATVSVEDEETVTDNVSYADSVSEDGRITPFGCKLDVVGRIHM